ncbi:BTAD domain-containing putative transcriptional regulator, partial [[Kitasatospora] papulosa]|uniref:AfsR/SARP family transcriptional regulator n=1 Tax=[Kitasatospora] papulosa TaxID=1464011 RepID=UPI00367C422F
MDIDILGALGVRENGVSIAPTAPKPRQVLALLALHADQVVSVTDLIEDLWSGQPPRSARTTLQTYVLQLRELIATALEKDTQTGGPTRGPKDVLTTLPGGYLLWSGGGTSDVREFERLADIGYRAMEAGDYSGAARKLRDALALWTGSAFADVQTGTQLE